jgi:putative membrane protein
VRSPAPDDAGSPRREAEDLDVDARFLLANERTLLAWVRTALAFLIAGLGVQQFATDLRSRELLTLSLLGLGLLCAVAGAARFLASDRALRAGRLPNSGRGTVVLAGLLVLVALASMIAVVVGAAG